MGWAVRAVRAVTASGPIRCASVRAFLRFPGRCQSGSFLTGCRDQAELTPTPGPRLGALAPLTVEHHQNPTPPTPLSPNAWPRHTGLMSRQG